MKKYISARQARACKKTAITAKFQYIIDKLTNKFWACPTEIKVNLSQVQYINPETWWKY